MANPLKRDPTRTLTFRRRMKTDLRRLLASLKEDLRKLIIDDDAFGLSPDRTGLTVNFFQMWRFATLVEKIDSFKRWLSDGIRKYFGGATTEKKVSDYITETATKGMNISYDDVKKTFGNLPLTQEQILGYSGAKSQVISSLLSDQTVKNAMAVQQVKAIGSLEGIGEYVKSSLVRQVTEELTKGSTKEVLFDKISDTLSSAANRTDALAETTIVSSHAEGQLLVMEKMGIKEVGGEVEWNAANDACELCVSFLGERIAIEKAHGLIPAHPNCRCKWIPVKEEVKEKK